MTEERVAAKVAGVGVLAAAKEVVKVAVRVAERVVVVSVGVVLAAAKAAAKAAVRVVATADATAGVLREASEGRMATAGEREKPVQAGGSVVEAASPAGARATARGASRSRCSRLPAHRSGTRNPRHRRRTCRPTSSREWSTRLPSTETSTEANTRRRKEPVSEETEAAATATEKAAVVVRVADATDWAPPGVEAQGLVSVAGATASLEDRRTLRGPRDCGTHARANIHTVGGVCCARMCARVRVAYNLRCGGRTRRS